jgi:hypothetical protein
LDFSRICIHISPDKEKLVDLLGSFQKKNSLHINTSEYEFG